MKTCSASDARADAVRELPLSASLCAESNNARAELYFTARTVMFAPAESAVFNSENASRLAFKAPLDVFACELPILGTERADAQIRTANSNACKPNLKV